MKRLEEIKNEYAFVNQYPNWNEFISELPVYQREEHYDKVTELYAREVAQASLEKAAEVVSRNYNDSYECKQDILNPKNITLL